MFFISCSESLKDKKRWQTQKRLFTEAERRGKEAESPLALAETALEEHVQIFGHMLKGTLDCWRGFRKGHRDYLQFRKCIIES